jgi:hypothetical protein
MFGIEFQEDVTAVGFVIFNECILLCQLYKYFY